jgi:hypothetical protein
VLCAVVVLRASAVTVVPAVLAEVDTTISVQVVVEDILTVVYALTLTVAVTVESRKELQSLL